MITTYHDIHTASTGRKHVRGNHMYRPLRSKKRRLVKKYSAYCPRCRSTHRTDNETPKERVDTLLANRFARGIRKAEDARIIAELLDTWKVTI